MCPIDLDGYFSKRVDFIAKIKLFDFTYKNIGKELKKLIFKGKKLVFIANF